MSYSSGRRTWIHQARIVDIAAHEDEDVASPGLRIESIGEAEVHRRDNLAKMYLATDMNHYALQRRGYFDRPEVRVGVQIGVADLSGGREGGGKVGILRD